MTPRRRTLDDWGKAGLGAIRAAHKRLRTYPRRYHFVLFQACKRIGKTYLELEIYNPYATGLRQNVQGAYQYLDALVVTPDRQLVAVDIIDEHLKNYKRERRYAAEKRRYLSERGVLYLVLDPPPPDSLTIEMQIKRLVKEKRT